MPGFQLLHKDLHGCLELKTGQGPNLLYRQPTPYIRPVIQQLLSGIDNYLTFPMTYPATTSLYSISHEYLQLRQDNPQGRIPPPYCLARGRTHSNTM